ncbi:MAG TPA: hypothetical protein VGH88_01740 [Streptosporangiaceae bacterium]|jgi:hypothetical protein
MFRDAEAATDQPITRTVVMDVRLPQVKAADRVLQAGDVFYEPEGACIARFDAGADGVTFLAYFLLEPGQESELTPLDE